MLPLELFRSEPVPDFRIAGQCSGAAARRVAQNEIELQLQLRDISLPEFDIGPVPQCALHVAEPPRADVAGDNCGFRVSLCKNRRFAAGRGAGIKNPLPMPGKLCDELRSFILNSNSTFAKSGSR